ncbi:hypothetical protein [Telmatospirillum sp.]|uniref:hypothetical protein n=1 Tax=Telmatospirillum sp. TaxID=2079197 RepID=UPI0028441C6D|nr:hypothetical protein [Telmatospirillum sp.]MDR3436447.1 hypothetical protein [Telmatospirillum sp.]
MAETFQSVVVSGIGGTNPTAVLTMANKGILLGFYVSNLTKGEKGFTATLTRGDVTIPLAPAIRVAGQGAQELMKAKMVLFPGDVITASAVATDTFSAILSWLDGVS